jgi:murein DD-endopeptidase MepM/ murein hydrolase activator NlpD
MSSRTALVLLFAAAALYGGIVSPVRAQSVADRIDEYTDRIEDLREEIAELQKTLNTTSQQKQTLESAVRALDLNIQKLTSSIRLTETEIRQKDGEIAELGGNILTTSERIGVAQNQIGNTLRELQELDQRPMAAALLGGATLSSLFDEAASLSSVRENLRGRVAELSTFKTDLEVDKSAAEEARAELAALQAKLSNEKRGLDVSRVGQAELLKETQNQESTYQALIAQKRAQQAAFESELRQFEAQLGLNVGAGQIPKSGSGVLRWPVSNPLVTQYFGRTAFATANPQIYSGVGHNGIDLRASPGSPIRSARTGIVKAAGNTDEQRGCYSYGRWALIEHDNGLSTLYAHLSALDVRAGQAVAGGEVIGLSGGVPGVFGSGYSTGPHLHFGVFASAGVKVQIFSNSINCKQVQVPLVDPSAYLNPLSYL